jgi:hypothetical protein
MLVGSGVGVVVGAYLGTAAVWGGALVGLVGVVLALIGSWRQPHELISPNLSAGQGPRLSGLDTRVEQILALAQEQANDHRRAAEQEAERLVAAAQAESQAILDKARTGASRIDRPFGERQF